MYVCAAPPAALGTNGSLNEGEGDKEFDGVTKNSMGSDEKSVKKTK